MRFRTALIFALLAALPAAAFPDTEPLPEIVDGSVFEEDSSDAELSPDLAAGATELEELLEAEARALEGFSGRPSNLGRLGPANPLRHRALDALYREDGALAAPGIVPEGDAGEILAELGGIDLAALKARYDIPIEINDEVLSYIRFFQGSGRKWFSRWLARSHRWIPVLQPILAEEGLPADTVYLAMIESGFSAYAYSWARASGMWQFISATGQRYGLRDDFWVDERRDPVLATRAAARYLRDLYKEFGHWYLAWAGYNAGEGKIRRASKMYETTDFWEMSSAGSYLRRETKHYVPKLIAAAIVAKHPERFGFEGIEPEGPYEYDEVEVPDATDLAVVARAAGVELEAVQQLNPALRRWCTPPSRQGRGYKVKLPPGTSERFAAEFAQVPASQRLTFRHHRVERGDTLSAIARKFGLPADAILKLNGIKNERHLRVGMDLLLPLPTQIAGRFLDTSTTSPQRLASRGRAAPQRVRVERATSPAGSGKGQYVVRAGDTLWSIAQRFGVAVDDLKQWNGIGRGGHTALQVGRTLQVSPPQAARPVRTSRSSG